MPWFAARLNMLYIFAARLNAWQDSRLDASPIHSLRFAVPVTFKRGAYKRGAYIRGACKCPTFKHRYHVIEPQRGGQG